MPEEGSVLTIDNRQGRWFSRGELKSQRTLPCHDPCASSDALLVSFVFSQGHERARVTRSGKLIGLRAVVNDAHGSSIFFFFVFADIDLTGMVRAHSSLAEPGELRLWP